MKNNYKIGSATNEVLARTIYKVLEAPKKLFFLAF
jgi:hypothetical protein